MTTCRMRAGRVHTSGLGLGMRRATAQRQQACRMPMRAQPAAPTTVIVPRVSQRRKVTARANSTVDTFGSTYNKLDRWATNNRMAISGFVNGSVVALVVVGATYKLIEVDLEISRGWTLFEFLVNTAQDDFERYIEAAATHPFVTKAMTSCVAYTLGDFAAQSFQGRNIFSVDLTRSARSGMAGFFIHGPFCHLWIEWMEAHLSFGGAWWAVFAKVAADQTVWSLFLNTCYTSTILGLSGKGPAYIAEEVKATCWPALSSGWRFWPFVHCISFSPFVPTDLKLLFIDTMEIIWVTILASVVNRDEDVVACPIDGATAAANPIASITMAKEVQFQQVKEDQYGEKENVVLNTMEMDEMTEMKQDYEDGKYDEIIDFHSSMSIEAMAKEAKAEESDMEALAELLEEEKVTVEK